MCVEKVCNHDVGEEDFCVHDEYPLAPTTDQHKLSLLEDRPKKKLRRLKKETLPEKPLVAKRPKGRPRKEEGVSGVLEKMQ